MQLLLMALAATLTSGPATPVTRNQAPRQLHSVVCERQADCPSEARRRRRAYRTERWYPTPEIPLPETREECEERLGSQSPSHLEQALLDLKCSQRPSDASTD